VALAVPLAAAPAPGPRRLRRTLRRPLVGQLAGSQLVLEPATFAGELQLRALVVDARIAEVELPRLLRLARRHRQRGGERHVVEQRGLGALLGVDEPVLGAGARAVRVPEALALPDPVRRDARAVDELAQVLGRELLGETPVRPLRLLLRRKRDDGG